METDSIERKGRNSRLRQQNVLFISNSSDKNSPSHRYGQTIATFFSKKLITNNKKIARNAEDFAAFCDAEDVVFVVFSLEERKASKQDTKRFLRLARELRIPYLFTKNYLPQNGDINSVLAPITYLPEEKEKAPWATHFGKFGHCTTHILAPNDKGSRAKKNVAFAQKLLSAEKCTFKTHNGTKRSYSNWKEIITYANRLKVSIILYSASREYSLDDLFFGPYEQKLILKSDIPVLLINPRDDLYVLCGE